MEIEKKEKEAKRKEYTRVLKARSDGAKIWTKTSPVVKTVSTWLKQEKSKSFWEQVPSDIKSQLEDRFAELQSLADESKAASTPSNKNPSDMTKSVADASKLSVEVASSMLQYIREAIAIALHGPP